MFKYDVSSSLWSKSCLTCNFSCVHYFCYVWHFQVKLHTQIDKGFIYYVWKYLYSVSVKKNTHKNAWNLCLRSLAHYVVGVVIMLTTHCCTTLEEFSGHCCLLCMWTNMLSSHSCKITDLWPLIMKRWRYFVSLV